LFVNPPVWFEMDIYALPLNYFLARTPLSFFLFSEHCFSAVHALSIFQPPANAFFTHLPVSIDSVFSSPRGYRVSAGQLNQEVNREA
jgi:hypothetical protein